MNVVLASASAIIGWQLYYSDGSVVSSKDTSWGEAPDQDVQVLVLTLLNGLRQYSNGNDYYYFHPDLGYGEVWSTDEEWADKSLVPEGAIVKYGKWMPTIEDWRVIYRKALADKW